MKNYSATNSNIIPWLAMNKAIAIHFQVLTKSSIRLTSRFALATLS